MTESDVREPAISSAGARGWIGVVMLRRKDSSRALDGDLLVLDQRPEAAEDPEVVEAARVVVTEVQPEGGQTAVGSPKKAMG